MTYSLIDLDVTPYSSEEKIRAWIERLEGDLKSSPDDVGIQVTLEYLRHILANKSA